MGYCYDNAGRLCCDSCGTAGNVRKNTCPHKVHYADGSSLPYCPPPALCPACLKKHGGTAKIHAGCKEHAARSNAREVENARRYAAGELKRGAAWGDWHEKVPAGMVGVLFNNPSTGQERYKLIEAARYNAHEWLSEFEPLTDWTDHPGARTKQVDVKDIFTLTA